MSDTIREQIIQKLSQQLTTIMTVNGYNYNLGALGVRSSTNPDGSVLRAPPYTIPVDELPLITFFPGLDGDVEFVYGKVRQTMSVMVRGYMIYGSENPSVAGEKILGDLVRCLTEIDWSGDCLRRLAFTSGGTYAVKAGDFIVGATSEAEATVYQVLKSSGTWAGGDAAGYFLIQDQSGFFATELLSVGETADVASIAGDSSVYPSTGLVDEILYRGGGIESYPTEEHPAVVSMCEIGITYKTIQGNPYQQ